MPFNLQVSVCVIVPLALAFLISGVLWDVLCFNCDGSQQSQAAVLQAAKDRTRSRSDGPVEESGAQLSSSTIKVWVQIWNSHTPLQHWHAGHYHS